MNTLIEEETVLVIPENWQESFKLSKWMPKGFCSNCGLEGCKPQKHVGYDPNETALDMGEDILFEN